MEVLKISDLHLRRDTREVLAGVHVSIRRGERRQSDDAGEAVVDDEELQQHRGAAHHLHVHAEQAA